MPIGTRVDRLYKELLAKGYDKKNAAKIAQAKTGLALLTGKPPKKRKGEFSGRKYKGPFGRLRSQGIYTL